LLVLALTDPHGYIEQVSPLKSPTANVGIREEISGRDIERTSVPSNVPSPLPNNTFNWNRYPGCDDIQLAVAVEVAGSKWRR